MKVCFPFCILCLVALVYSQVEMDRVGPEGDQGDPGFPGLKGKDGARGFAGYPGPKGDRGLIGKQGQRGRRGPDGPSGPVGSPQLCEKELFGPVNQDLETLEKITTKLELAIHYDFVRTVAQKYFVSNKETGPFSRAVAFCSQQGLQLALPQSEEENIVLTQFFEDVYKTSAWISVNNKKEEGNFDLENQPLTFTKWGDAQPDRSIRDTGCTMLSENGVWRVTSECSLNAYIICQI